MTIPSSHYITIKGLEFHYVEWGNAEKPPLVFWHGFARTSRDFDDLAQALAADWHIFAPDTIGRGLSQWSPAPERDYNNDAFADFATGFLDGLGLGVVDWVGTSMGGGIAIRAGAGPLKGRIRRLVLNDIGPKINEVARQRIRAYAGTLPSFARVSELEAYFRQVYKPFGFLTDAQWRRLAETSTRRLPDGRITPHYDPKIVVQFDEEPDDFEQWSHWDRLECDVMCLRGEDSDLLLAPVAEEMTRRGPGCRLVTIKGCGHAPALNVPDQINLVADFLRNG
ncbi:MAG: alpha/beta fold hydrolase [Beijerinckiaceae bacterium]